MGALLRKADYSLTPRGHAGERFRDSVAFSFAENLERPAGRYRGFEAGVEDFSDRRSCANLLNKEKARCDLHPVGRADAMQSGAIGHG